MQFHQLVNWFTNRVPITSTNPYNKLHFYSCKNDNFQLKNFDNFLIFVQNINCGYTLERLPTIVNSFLTVLNFIYYLRYLVLENMQNTDISSLVVQMYDDGTL